jgi:transposase
MADSDQAARVEAAKANLPQADLALGPERASGSEPCRVSDLREGLRHGSAGLVGSDDLVVDVRLYRRQRHRCGRCGRRSAGYDSGEGRRRWRSLDLGTVQTFIEAEAPRVECLKHGVVVARVPWADHDSRFTHAFEEQAAWLAVECSKTAVSLLMRTSWRTVGRILIRDARRLYEGRDRLDGLRRIGIDEISYKKRHRHLVVVVDHDRKRLVWAAEGRDEATLDRFFYELGPERCALITHVSADAADWIENVVELRCP